MELYAGKIAEKLISEALALGASDLHVEPAEDSVKVRVRIDGLLQELCRLSANQHSTIVTQLKVLSGMDIGEKRVPQDGRIAFNANGREADLRLSTLPTLLGEKIAVRLLRKQQELQSLDNLAFNEAVLQQYRRLINAPNGLILLTGPTGSGKTTTMYATLRELNNSTRNIVTVEDPVEYRLENINQVAVNRKAGLDFATGLRAIVRQDPDIIMLGEIRDRESAAIAVHAALTGHLVLSTLHTNSAVGSIARLTDMGVERYLLAAALRGALAQRLVRQICPYCREQYAASTVERAFLGHADEELVLWRGAGCEHCRGTGYKGRLAVQELFIADAAAVELIGRGAAEQKLTLQDSLYADGVEKVLAGQTTVTELWRAGIAPGGCCDF